MIESPYMNMPIEGGPRHRELPPKPLDWKELRTPLQLLAADELGAFFKEIGNDRTWYFDHNEMHFRPIEEADVPKHRAEQITQYDMPPQFFATGTDAAMRVREHHLEEQVRVLAVLKDSLSKEIREDLEDELGLIRAYLAERNPVEKGRLAKDLDETYREMKEDIPLEPPHERSEAA